MSKRSHKALASATVMSLILTSTLTATNVQAAAEVTRMPGADRFATAQEVATQAFGKAENVVLVNGLGYADAVSATPFAKAINAPILLTDASNKPSADLLATLTKLEAKNIYIVGGTGVVTEAMQSELAKTYKVERIAGDAKDGRYGTNAAVAKKVLESTKATNAVLVSAEGYADALSVASIAATKGMPVLFGNRNEVPEVVKNIAKDLKVMAVGGDVVLPESVLSQVKAERIAKGADRFETNLKVLGHFKADLKFDNIYVAAGGDDNKSKFADALVASAAAAKNGAPVVLNGLGANSTRVSEANKFIKDNMGDSTKVTIVGGEASVSKAIEDELRGKKDSDGKAEVSSIEALNLNQVKIVFAGKVDSDSAEDVSNYEVDGNQLTKYDKDKSYRDTDAIAVLQDDDRTVILTLAKSQEQQDETTVKVRKGVLSEDKVKTVKEYEKDVTFKDLVNPTVKKVEVRGNSKLIVEFSEAVFVKDAIDEHDAADKLADELEINGQTVKSVGADYDLSKAKDTLIFEKGAYVNKVEYYFASSLDTGTNKLKVPDGEKGEILCDAAGFKVQEVTKEFKVDDVTSKPRVKKITGGTDGKIYIDFDRAMDAETAVEKSNYKLNDHTLPSDAKIELKKDDTQVKITGVGGDIKTGSNTVEISDNVRDAYGNKVAEDTRENFKAEKDDTKPKVASITSIDAETIRVRFTEDVRYTHATNTKNYELKDSSGTDISSDIKEVKAANGTDDDTDVYDIKLKDEKNLSSKKYTLKIKNIADTSDNIMDDYEGQLNGEDDVAPKVDGARRDGKKIVIQFSEEMDSSSVKKAANYRYIDKENKVKELPSKTDIKLASDSKTVTIEFKDSYEAEDQIKGIIVKSDVKDLAGNNMEADYQDRNMNSDLAIKVLDSSIKMSEPSSDVEVEMQFTAAVKKPVKNKFLFYKDGNSSDYVIADTVRPSGDKLIFKFKDGEDNNKFVKEAGADLKIRFDKDAAENEAGQSIQANDVKLYDNLIKPELDIDEKNGYVDNWGFDETNNTVTIKFDTQLDPTMVGAYTDDFNFISDKNSKLEVKSVKIVNGTYLVYTMESSTPVKGSDKITVTAIKDKVTIRTKKDRAGNTQPYEPSSKDTNGRKVNRKNFNVEENTEYAKKLADAKAAVSKAESSRKQADVDAARELVKGLKDSDREDLTKRLDSIKVISNGFTVETKAGAVVGTTIVMVKDVDAAKYDVFVDGQEARLVDGTFVVTINKTLTTAEAEKLVQLKEKSTTPVENFTVETKPGAVVGTTIVMVKGVDASKTVTVDGEATRNVNGTFVVTINKTLTADEAKALVVIK